MAETTPIEWTDATWNPVTGCSMVTAGCTNCYAMGLAGSRLRNHPSRAGLTRMTGGRHVWTGEVRLNEDWLDLPLRWQRPRRIFVCAHGDLFHEAVPDEWIDRVFAVMALAPQHTFQVLTKRPERAREMLNAVRRPGLPERTLRHINALAANNAQAMAAICRPILQLPNVWLGTSIEDQATADTRIPHLLATPAAVRFVSAEPLLGRIILDDMCDGWKFYDALRGNWWHDCEPPKIERGKPKIDWVIVGGESGPGARPMHPDWARSLRDQCVSAGTSFFFKQWGTYLPEDEKDAHGFFWVGGSNPGETIGWPDGSVSIRVGKKTAGRTLDGRLWDQMPEPKTEAAA